MGTKVSHCLGNSNTGVLRTSSHQRLMNRSDSLGSGSDVDDKEAPDNLWNLNSRMRGGVGSTLAPRDKLFLQLYHDTDSFYWKSLSTDIDKDYRNESSDKVYILDNNWATREVPSQKMSPFSSNFKLRPRRLSSRTSSEFDFYSDTSSSVTSQQDMFFDQVRTSIMNYPRISGYDTDYMLY